MINIRKYDENKDYKHILDSLIIEKWQSFYEERKEEYKIALNSSITYVLYEDDVYCGYIRCLTDQVFTLFVAEIIVIKEKRFKGFGKALIFFVHDLFPKTRIDLLSDSDSFYTKLGFRKIDAGMRYHNWY